MRQLLPEPRAEIDPGEAYAADERPAAGERPWVLVNMIASADGGTAVEGRSGGLGGPADKAVFRALRSLADVILVAAGTVRAEGYRPPALPPELIEARRRRGQAPLPRLAVVTRRLDLETDLPLFTGDGPRPVVVTTTDAPADRADRLGQVADLLACGTGSVDLGDALVALRRSHGAGVVLAEGGPSLNGGLFDAGAVDELCLSLAPALVGGASPRIISGAGAGLVPLALTRALEADGYLFLRYSRPVPG